MPENRTVISQKMWNSIFLQSSVMYIMSITKQIMESMVESFILKHWQMVKKLYLFQKIMDTKQRWDMYLSAGPGTQSPINRTVNIRSAAQTVILSFIPVVKKVSWIRFVSNGGTAVDPQLVSYGENSQKPSDPVKAGYIFDGWFTDEDCSQAYTFGQTVETDLILYAKWREGTAGYKVVYWKETLTTGVYDYVSQESASGATGSTVKADIYGNATMYPAFIMIQRHRKM